MGKKMESTILGGLEVIEQKMESTTFTGDSML